MAESPLSAALVHLAAVRTATRLSATAFSSVWTRLARYILRTKFLETQTEEPDAGNSHVRFCKERRTATPGVYLMQPEVAHLAPGTIIAGKFRVLRLLGVGGMGVVYEIEHELTKHRRA